MIARAIIITVIMSATAMAAEPEPDPAEVARLVAELRQVEKDRAFHEYKLRRAERRTYAMDQRRRLNSRKVHVYGIARPTVSRRNFQARPQVVQSRFITPNGLAKYGYR